MASGEGMSLELYRRNKRQLKREMEATTSAMERDDARVVLEKKRQQR